MSNIFKYLFWYLYLQSLKTEIWITIIIIWSLLAIFSAYIAKTKNRNPAAWFFSGLFFGIFAFLTIGFLPPLKTEEAEDNSVNNNKEEIIAKRILELISEGKSPSDAKIQAESEYILKKEDEKKAEKEKLFLDKNYINLLTKKIDTFPSNLKMQAERLLNEYNNLNNSLDILPSFMRYDRIQLIKNIATELQKLIPQKDLENDIYPPHHHQ